MANEIKDKFSAAAALTITLASLASSTAGVGRQSDMVDNTSDRFQRIKIYIKTTLGTSPANNTAVYVYLIRGDKHGTAYRTDNAGASDAGLTVQNAGVLGVIRGKASAATGDVLYGEFEIVSPGPEWGICIVQDTTASLNSTAGNHFVHWVGADPEIQ